MIEEDSNVQALFAEDIREELNGQFSLIGIFGDSIEADTFPFGLPKLAILILVSTLIDAPTLIQNFRIFTKNKDGDEVTVISHSLPEEDITRQKVALDKIQPESPDQRWANLSIKLGSKNISFNEELRLLVEITSVSGKKYQSNALTIKKKETSGSHNLSIN